MSTDPILQPICAFDIWLNGQAAPAEDMNIEPAAGASYRWMHFDLGNPVLADWCAKQLPPLATRTLLADKTRPRVDEHDNGLLLMLRGVNLNEGEEVEDMVSLRLWITPKLIVSVRKLHVFAVDDLRAQIKAGDAPPTPSRLIARITENLIDRIESVSLDLEERADAMEEEVYDNHAHALPELAPLRRTAIKLSRHIGPLSDALISLAAIETPLIPKNMRSRLRDTANRATRSVEEVHEVRDRLTALSEHLDLNTNNRLGRNSYLLSIVAAIFMPLGFLTGLFGVNVAGMPGVENPNAFAILCVAMVALGILMYFVLRWIRWF